MAQNVTTPAAEKLAGKYLLLVLGAELYAIPALSGKEIISTVSITKAPAGAPNFVRGVMNLRKRTVPVVDIRSKLSNEPAPEFTQRTCVVVLELSFDAAHTLIGIIADSVKVMLNFEAKDIQPTSEIHGTGNECVAGIAKASQGNPVILLDLGTLFTSSEVDALAELSW